MATSEYLRNGEGTKRTQAPVLQLPSATRHGVIGPATVASVVMMANDVLMILLAFGMALALRMLVVSRIAPTIGKGANYWATPIDLFYLGWFALAFILVSRRYGLPMITEVARSWPTHPGGRPAA